MFGINKLKEELKDLKLSNEILRDLILSNEKEIWILKNKPRFNVGDTIEIKDECNACGHVSDNDSKSGIVTEIKVRKYRNFRTDLDDYCYEYFFCNRRNGMDNGESICDLEGVEITIKQ